MNNQLLASCRFLKHRAIKTIVSKKKKMTTFRVPFQYCHNHKVVRFPPSSPSSSSSSSTFRIYSLPRTFCAFHRLRRIACCSSISKVPLSCLVAVSRRAMPSHQRTINAFQCVWHLFLTFLLCSAFRRRFRRLVPSSAHNHEALSRRMMDCAHV